MEAILIADDHEIVRHGIRIYIESLPVKYKFFEASTCKEVIQVLSNEKVDYTILDMHLEDGNIFSTVSQFIDYCNKTRVLVYTMNAEKIYARRLMQKGIKGFVSKQAPMQQMQTAIRSVLNGEIYLSTVIKEALTQPEKTDRFVNPINSLSDRELEVVEYVSSGVGIKEIAILMHLDVTTVSTYKRRAFAKLGVENILDLRDKFTLYKMQG